ncbi:glycerol-3-phosphate dehydrogenase [Marinivivus vitaminiproducens]|nr:glycerol-3-phosphate dehydrogenase [Geminicoccaceae bacterium SCSIO 64248]
MDEVDLLVVGGGINGVGIARDAAGRGLRVLLAEKGDLGEGTSSRSGKYIHGGLRYLEYYEFRLVREALIEREVLLKAAPHIIWPMRMVIPHSPEQRPAWLVRLGLFLYDHLGGLGPLPGTRALDLRRDPEGRFIRKDFTKAFAYSDCWVDDARLVVLNAIDAAERGAAILPRTEVVGARREGPAWLVDLESHGRRRTVRAKGLVNAAGPWVEQVLGRIDGVRSTRRVRLVKGSHIILPKFWDGPQAYVLQHTDKRIIFVNPYEDDLALIGTTDIAFDGRPEDVAIDNGEIAYLFGIIERYFKVRLRREDLLHGYSGVRPLYDDDAANPSAVTRDYIFDIDQGGGEVVTGRSAGGDSGSGTSDGTPPLLSVFGGKITTFRKLAEHALDKLQPCFPAMGKAWTREAHLPGGDMADADAALHLEAVSRAHPWLPRRLARHYARLYGTRIDRVLDGATGLAGLGRHFGGLFYEAEAHYLMQHEWAETADDILFRRTKHHLRLTAAEREGFALWLETQAGGGQQRRTG